MLAGILLENEKKKFVNELATTIGEIKKYTTDDVGVLS